MPETNSEREKRILEAAAGLIVRYGFDKTTVDEIITLIRDAGFTPAQRTTDYEIIRTY